MPRILLPSQHAELESRIANIDELITDESLAFGKEKEAGRSTITKNKARIEELTSKLTELRKQVKPLEIRGRATTEHTDDLGRQKRSRRDEDMQVDQEEKEGERAREKERENEKEAGVQIRGDNGDIEVEY